MERSRHQRRDLESVRQLLRIDKMRGAMGKTLTTEPGRPPLRSKPAGRDPVVRQLRRDTRRTA